QLLSVVFLWKKQHAQAIAEGKQALAFDPNNADSYLNLGWILTFAGQPEEAIEWLEQAIRRNPRSPPGYLHFLGWANIMARRYEPGASLLQKVLRLNPNYVPSHIILAMGFAEMDQQKNAQAEADEVMRLLPYFSLDAWKQKWPYKDPAMLERKLAALRKAGLK